MVPDSHELRRPCLMLLPPMLAAPAPVTEQTELRHRCRQQARSAVAFMPTAYFIDHRQNCKTTLLQEGGGLSHENLPGAGAAIFVAPHHIRYPLLQEEDSGEGIVLACILGKQCEYTIQTRQRHKARRWLSITHDIHLGSLTALLLLKKPNYPVNSTSNSQGARTGSMPRLVT
jgi:hypothetical protein